MHTKVEYGMHAGGRGAHCSSCALSVVCVIKFEVVVVHDERQGVHNGLDRKALAVFRMGNQEIADGRKSVVSFYVSVHRNCVSSEEADMASIKSGSFQGSFEGGGAANKRWKAATDWL